MAMSRSRRTPRNFLEGYFNDDFWKSSCDTSNPTRVPFSLSLASSYEHSMDSSLPSVLLFKIFYSSHFVWLVRVLIDKKFWSDHVWGENLQRCHVFLFLMILSFVSLLFTPLSSQISGQMKKHLLEIWHIQI